MQLPIQIFVLIRLLVRRNGIKCLKNLFWRHANHFKGVLIERNGKKMVAILSIFTLFCLSSYFVIWFLKLKLILFNNRAIYYYTRIFLILLPYYIYIYIYKIKRWGSGFYWGKEGIEKGSCKLVARFQFWKFGSGEPLLSLPLFHVPVYWSNISVWDNVKNHFKLHWYIDSENDVIITKYEAFISWNDCKFY